MLKPLLLADTLNSVFGGNTGADAGSIVDETSKTFGEMLTSAFDSIIKYEMTAYGPIRVAGVQHFLILVFAALILGLIMSQIYINLTKKGIPSTNFALSCVILPPIIAAVVFLVGNNVASAFSLAGIFSITRFRSASGNAKDITFVFVLMGIGLACGTGYVAYALVITLVLAIVLTTLSAINYGEPKSVSKILRINVPESLSYDSLFDEIFKKYAIYWEITRVKTIDLGAAYQISYKMMVKEGVSEKEFIDELRCRNGNLNIILVLDNKGDNRGM